MSHLWVLLSLLSAFSLATSDALAKKAVEGNNEYLIAWFRLLFTLPLLVIFLAATPRPPLDNDFYRAFIMALPLELISIVLYIKALKVSPLSLTVPFLALTPVFLIFNSFFILGEKVSPQGAAGIFLIAAGSYVLHFNEMKKGLFGPFRAVFREKGSRYMIIVAFLYSITSSFGKMAIAHSSPVFFGATYFIAVTAAFTPVALWSGRGETGRFIAERKKNLFLLVPAGISYAVMVLSHMEAMRLTKVAYMISLKRVSLLIAVFYGYLFFREQDIAGRAAGAMLMFAGFVLVVNSG